MKKLPLVALGLLLLSISVSAQTRIADRTEWREFNFLEGGIKVTFPGEPSRSTAEREQPAGKITSTELHLSFPQITFMITWSDFLKAAAAATVGPRRVDLVEPFEDMLQVLGRDSAA